MVEKLELVVDHQGIGVSAALLVAQLLLVVARVYLFWPARARRLAHSRPSA